jgi:hypothetical protein
MAATPQTQAIQNANTIVSLSQQLFNLSAAITQANQAWQNNGSGGILAAMGTVALNADGSLGTADVVPVISHPLNPATYPGLARALSSNQYASLLTIINNIPTYVGGTQVNATSGVPGTLSTAVGG